MSEMCPVRGKLVEVGVAVELRDPCILIVTPPLKRSLTNGLFMGTVGAIFFKYDVTR
jgi:hypothetical protein